MSPLKSQQQFKLSMFESAANNIASIISSNPSIFSHLVPLDAAGNIISRMVSERLKLPIIEATESPMAVNKGIAAISGDCMTIDLKNDLEQRFRQIKTFTCINNFDSSYPDYVVTDAVTKSMIIEDAVKADNAFITIRGMDGIEMSRYICHKYYKPDGSILFHHISSHEKINNRLRYVSKSLLRGVLNFLFSSDKETVNTLIVADEKFGIEYVASDIKVAYSKSGIELSFLIVE